MQGKQRISLSWIRPEIVGLALLIFLYLGLELSGLVNVPLVHQDEAWISSPAENLARNGVFADPRFKGFAGQDRAYFGFPPLYPLLLALIFKFLSLGLVQARLLSVSCGLSCLLLTYWIARQIFPQQKTKGSWLGYLACLLLVSWRLIENGPSNFLSGIPLLDQGRIVRYDMLVPVFGLAAWWLYLCNRSFERKLYYLLIGVLGGLAGLAHLFGLFWLPVLLALVLADKGFQLLWHSVVPYLIILGGALAWLPWLFYCGINWDAFMAQGLEYQNQFQLTSFDFYYSNLLNEPKRFLIGAGWNTPNWQFGYSPASWLLLLTLITLLVCLFYAPWYSANTGLKTIVLPLATQLIFFSFFLQNKTVTYAISIWPLLALLAAWTILRLWSLDFKKQASLSGLSWKSLLIKAGILLLLAAILGQGVLSWIGLVKEESSFTGYQNYLDRVATLIPPDSRVIGLHDYWLGLNQFRYHAISTAFFRAEEGYSKNQVPLEKALNELDGNILLFDRHLQAFLNESSPDNSPRHQEGQELIHWMKTRSATLIGQVDDSYYGLILIYQLFPS